MLRMKITGNMPGMQRAGRSMRSKSARREASLAHVPPAQQRAGVVRRHFTTGAGPIEKFEPPKPASARPLQRFIPRV
jgi:hypothetical protein